MARTFIPSSDPRTKRLWASRLVSSTIAETMWGKNMMSSQRNDPNAPVQVVDDLKKSKGEEIIFSIYAQLGGQPVFGDDMVEGNETPLDGYTDKVTINYVKKPVDVGGQMTRQRTEDDLRDEARLKCKEYLARFFDEAMSTTLAGSRGVNDDFIRPVGVNTYIPDTQPYTAYDAAHVVYGGAATSKATLQSTDKMSLDAIDKIITMAESEGGGQDGKMRLSALTADGGEDRTILLMHTWQEHDLRTATGTNRWVDIQKAATASIGYKSNLFRNNAGEYRGCVFRKHKTVVRFNDYGAGSNVGAARAVLMGRQALVLAHGDSGIGNKGNWVEKLYDRDDSKIAITGTICLGIKRPQFNGQDISSIALDTAVAKPY